MDIFHVLSKKIKGGVLNEDEIRFFVDSVTNGRMEDYQISAMLTAMYIHGLTCEELFSLTERMAYSGDFMPLSEDPMLVDKHSSGGVGDKISFICSPLIASLGMKIAKMSGRGLGHTGGTIDKLEAIPQIDITLSTAAFQHVLDEVGCVISGQTGNFCPADKKMYALRDVTATVDSLPLIASSIMSKKIASGAKNIILDVKCGHGAFMKDLRQAQSLAHLMLDIGSSFQRNMVVLITDMNEPLGCCVGNALEVIEATEVLKGKEIADLKEISVAIAGYAMVLTGLEANPEKAMHKAAEHLKNGKAFSKFRQMITMQKGDPSFLEDYERLPHCKKCVEVTAPVSGYIKDIDSELIGVASMLAGAGREKKEDTLDYGTGILFNKKISDPVKKNEVLATLFCEDEKRALEAKSVILDAFQIDRFRPERKTKILKVMSNIELEGDT